MKFTISIAAAKGSLESSNVVLSCNTATQEILRNFYIQANSDNKVLIIGTDLEVALLSWQDAQVSEPGSCLVSGKKLTDLVRYASGETLEFETHDGNLTVTSATGKAVLLTSDVSEYPVVEDFNPEMPYSTVNRGMFLDALNRTAFAVCEDERRGYLCSLQIENDMAMACDGKIVASYKSPAPLGLSSVCVPQRSLQPLVRILHSSTEESFSFQETPSFYYFKLGPTSFSLRRVDGGFPTAQMLQRIEKTKAANNVVLKVNKQAITSAIERVRLTANPDSNAIALDIMSDRVLIKSLDNLGNWSVDTIPASVENSNSTMSVYFNWVLLLSVLKSVMSETIEIKLSENNVSKSPLAVFDANFNAIVLPIDKAFESSSLH